MLSHHILRISHDRDLAPAGGEGPVFVLATNTKYDILDMAQFDRMDQNSNSNHTTCPEKRCVDAATSWTVKPSYIRKPLDSGRNAAKLRRLNRERCRPRRRNAHAIRSSKVDECDCISRENITTTTPTSTVSEPDPFSQAMTRQIISYQIKTARPWVKVHPAISMIGNPPPSFAQVSLLAIYQPCPRR
jgi:hypothetical protein